MTKTITKSLMSIFVALIFLIICRESIDVWMPNTGDFDRAITPFMSGIRQFSSDPTLIYSLKNTFSSIFSYEYKSSFSYILYAYAYILSLFTHTFDLRLWSALSKLIYIVVLFSLFRNIVNSNKLVWVFPLSILPLITPSILSQFTAIYQEQVVITLLPVIAIMLIKNERSRLDVALLVISTAIIATSKSQFFYLPILISACELIYRKNNNIIFHTAMACALAIAICFSIFSPSATKNNSYHSLYFGTLLYNKLNGYEVPEWAVDKCIGVDAWGNKFDLENGAVQTDIGNKCYKAGEVRGMKDAIVMVLKKPSILFMLPFDKGIQSQLSENYFHVYKANKLIYNKGNVLQKIQNAKDSLFSGIRIIGAFIVLIISWFFLKSRVAATMFVLSAFSLSQFYISFLGEGYRDLNKHLFAMNFSFDLMMFVLILILFRMITRKL